MNYYVITKLINFFVQHGRLKVKTTAQQQEEKRIERQKKAKMFTSVMKMIFAQVFLKVSLKVSLK